MKMASQRTQRTPQLLKRPQGDVAAAARVQQPSMITRGAHQVKNLADLDGLERRHRDRPPARVIRQSNSPMAARD